MPRRMFAAPWAMIVLVICGWPAVGRGQVPESLQQWLAPQTWERDVDQPVLSLGEVGSFDDTHIFAPMVVREGEQFLLWYCGSQGFAHDLAPKRVPDERVFKLGLATSGDGKSFTRSADNPVFAMTDPKRSVLTPCVLRKADGSPVREDGQLRMWFAAGTLGGGGAPQSLHETTSEDGIHWSEASAAQLERVYAPAVVKTQTGYEMWYTVPGSYPWVIKHGKSKDGRQWDVAEQPALAVTQDWEHDLVIYPSVIQVDGVYLMWYASYLDDEHLLTGIGFAASVDGESWHKHPQNPVLRPDSKRAWEANYVSSQCVARLADGSFRMWYASRKQPPFQNLYYALNTARWVGPSGARE